MTLHTKLKRRLIAQYMADTPTMEPWDWFRVGRGVSWRLRMVDRMAAGVSHGVLDRQRFIELLHAVSIRRQIEDDLTVYQEQLEDLTEDLREGEITEEEYESRVDELAIAILLLAFLLGRGGDDEDNLSADERAIVASAQAILSGDGPNTGAILSAFDDLDIDDDAKEQVNEAVDQATKSAAGLASAAKDASEAGIASRLLIWVTAALGLYTVGQLFAPGDARYMWRYGPTEHCRDCLRLNGQVHTAEQWRRSKWRPQGRELECGGWNCQCRLVQTTDPIQGNF